MKILCIFCDMLRSDKISLLNEEQKEDKLDLFLRKFGGTIFKNSFSPTPDTGRALASFFTGKCSKNNGCYFQYQYPKYYLKDIYNLGNLLEDKNIKYKFIIREESYILGNFPDDIKNVVRIDKKNSFKMETIKALNELKNSEDYFLFLDIDDYHLAVDVYGSIDEAYIIGKNKIYSVLKYIFENIDKNELDYTFIFSDHGHKDNITKQNIIKGDLNLLFPDRSKIFLLARKKNEKNIKINNNIKSILDFMPTFMDIFNIKIKNNFDGQSLFLNNKNRIIALEGNENFFDPYSKLNVWGAAHKDYIFITNKLKKIILSNKNIKNNIDEKQILNIIEKETCNYIFEDKKLLNEFQIRELKEKIKKINFYILTSYKYSDDSLISYKKYIKINIKSLFIKIKFYEIILKLRRFMKNE